MNTNQVFTILQTHVPASALEYCFTLWNASPFELKITKSRQTKVGDFTSRNTKRHPRITLNNDLNPLPVFSDLCSRSSPLAGAPTIWLEKRGPWVRVEGYVSTVDGSADE